MFGFLHRLRTTHNRALLAKGAELEANLDKATLARVEELESEVQRLEHLRKRQRLWLIQNRTDYKPPFVDALKELSEFVPAFLPETRTDYRNPVYTEIERTDRLRVLLQRINLEHEKPPQFGDVLELVGADELYGPR